MKFAVLSSLALLAATLTSATPGVSITAPVQSTIWQAGQSHVITWVPTNSTATTITQIELKHGNSAFLSSVGILSSTPIPVSQGQFTWNIDTTLPPDGAAVIVMTTDVGDLTYSGYFVISAIAPGTPNNFTGPATPLASTAAPVAGASSTAGTPVAAGASAGASAAGASAASTPKSAAAGLKAGVLAMVGAVGASVLLL